MAGKSIKPIDKAAIHRICSGQVVLDLATAVKELVENSLDAGSTSIEIRLKDYGAELIEVADNGSGVSSDNYQGLTLKYHTSKISEFADLQSLSSFGFRGEALSSLCALADVSIVTRTKDEAIATRLVYDHSGVIVSQEKLARAIGTTVSVSKLFATLPVRHKEFNRNIRREYGRLLTILQAYALIGRGIKLLCSNQAGRGGRTTVVQTQGNACIKDNIVTIFGTKTAASMEWLDLSVSENCYVEGFVSKPGAGCGRASGDRQFFYVNGRPVDMPKVAKLLNELYRSFNSLQYPMLVLNFILPTTSYDVNVTPDKRKVFLHSEGELMLALREALEKVYSPNKYTYSVNKLDDVTFSERVVSTSKLTMAASGQGCAYQESNVGGSSSDADEEEGNEENSASRLKEGNQKGNTSSSRRSPVDILSFQRKSSSDLNKKLSEVGASAVCSRGNLSVAQTTRKVQTTLTACTSKRKRDPVASELVSSELPLLKKWAKGDATGRRTNSLLNEEDSNARDFEHDSDGSIEEVPLDSNRRRKQSNPNHISESNLSSTGVVDIGSVPVTSTKRRGKTTSEFPIMLPKDYSTKAKLSIDDDVEESSRPELDENNHREGPRDTPGPGSEPKSGKHMSLKTTNYEDIHPRVSAITAPSKSDSRKHSATANIDLVAKGLADMRNMLAGSRLLSRPSNSRVTGSKADQQKDELVAAILLGSDVETENNTHNCHEGEPECSKTSTRILSECAMEAEGGNNVPDHEEEVEPSGSILTVPFNIENLRKNFEQSLLLRNIKKDMTVRQELPKTTSCFNAATLASCGVQNEGREKEALLAAATSELERSFNKADFKRMQVLGQFNLGFILAKIDGNIFIVDQHASDEKYNFERLTKNTVLNRQPLLRPLPMELSAADEIIVTTHMEIFRKNGFDFLEVEDAPTGQRLRLSAVPFSQNVTFGIGDVQELISLLAEEPVMSFKPCPGLSGASGNADDDSLGQTMPLKWLPRPSRVRAMLASRACRSSIMIGDSLSRKEMERILLHLAELDSPWNCPHGRPTMRHLVDLSSVGKR
ncbi:radial spoke head protein 10B [Marchantia polymorpha subsp. ruderalis]